MKNILIIFCLLANYLGMAQKLGEQAVFTECKNERLPAQCTEDKLTADITALITGDIITEMEKSGFNYFSVSVLIMSDGDGKIIPAETEIRCEENEALKTAIENYLNHLPAFYPKDSRLEETRSVHIINITYLQNTNNSNYHIASNEELKILKTPFLSYIKPDNAPLYPGCEGYDNHQMEMFCLTNNITKSIHKNYMMPRNITGAGQDKMHISLIIPIDGKMRVEDIAGSSKPFQDEVFRVVKKLPKIKPATKKGIPVTIHLNLPLTINVK